MIKLAVSGCHGRMGKRITSLALADEEFVVVTLLERADHPRVHEPVANIKVQTAEEALKGCDVLIEFTSPEATMKHLFACQEYGVKYVIGTTGLDENQCQDIKKASADTAIVFASNMSVGVNILFKLAEVLSSKAPVDYQVKITEAHHVHKKDAPSGTAKTLAEVIEKGSCHKVKDINSIREGEIVGDHEVVMESAQDIITIKHHAKDRDIFAKGSLVAAKFLMNKENGLYTMQNVLGLT